jgi:murein DD-endopeptidase MepM/ murein hydrolase activator NlpD
MESMRQDTKRIADDQKKIDKARSQSQKEFLFSTSFIKPVEGILTTPYGYTRYVNGKLDSSHRAIDLAAKEGTPIKATNDGIVVLSEMLYLTGNAIYIDHGMGLFSQYAHLSELRVKPGDHVKQGDIIGLVGTTGFSTGPHLHFTFWAHNVPVNPDLFFNTTPFHWLSVEDSALSQ